MAEPQGTPACALTTSGSISVVLFNREKQKENYPTPHTAYHTRHSASWHTLAQMHTPQQQAATADLLVHPSANSHFGKKGVLDTSRAVPAF